MARHLIAGQAALERSVNERGEWPEYQLQWEAWEEEGLDRDQIAQRFLDDPRWWATEPIDQLREDTLLQLDELAKSDTTCSLVQSYLWVAENVGNDLIRAQDAPSKTAWYLRDHIRDNPAGEAEFWKSMLPRLLPSSKELENQARYSDDGSTEIELAERIKKRMLDAGYKPPGCSHCKPDWHSHVTTDLYSGVPKDPFVNLDFRICLSHLASSDESMRQDLWCACSKSLLFYVNAFVYLFEPRTGDVLPFITYDFQDDTFMDLLDSVGRPGVREQHDLVVEKSRDMGVTWMCVTTEEWLWHFHENQTFKMMSRKEELVDKRGDDQELFRKVDFIHEHQPKWLLPNIRRMKMLKENMDNKSKLGGESTNEFATTGDRKRGLFIDEFSKMNNQRTVFRGTQAVSDSRWFVFTPEGASNKAYDIAHNPKFKKLTLHWSRHPVKRKGLYRVTDGVVEIIDKEWHEANPGYKFYTHGEFLLNGKVRSPWYDRECNRADHPMEILQEQEIDYLGSDYQFFDTQEIDTLMKRTMQPYSRGELDYDTDSAEPRDFVENSKGFLHWWMNFDAQGYPPSDRSFVIGVDISAGRGATNSCLTIGDNKTKEQIGQFAFSRIKPSAFAAYAVALCRWLKGPDGRGAYLIWEAPGPGMEFMDRVLELGYRNFFYRRQENAITKKISQVPGWWPTKDTKYALLGAYRRALIDGKYHVRSRPELEECRHYVFSGGWVIHSGAVNTDDESGARENHGDRPTSSALCWKGMNENVASLEFEEPEIPVGSFAWRTELAAQERRKQLAW